MPKYFIYARKSMESEERQQLSIPAQLDELREFAKKNDLQVIDSLIESQTAKKPGRKVFNELISRIEQGEADGILSWHADRLARNAVDAGQIINLLDTGRLLDLKFPTVDFQNNPSGKFMLSIAFATSKNYVDNLAVNTKRGLLAKARRGIFPGLAPLGYRNSRINGRKTITISKKWAPVVIRLFQKYATGKYTFNDLSLYLAKQGYLTQPTKKAGGHKPVKADRLKLFILQNPFYYGVFKYCGEIYQGKHKPLITKKLFDQVQAVMAKKCWSLNPNRDPAKRHYNWFAFGRLIKCGECGYHVTTTTKVKHYKNGASQAFNYFHCSKASETKHCSQSFTPQTMAMANLFKICQTVSLPEKSGNWLLDRLTEDEHQSQTKLGQVKAGLNNRLDELTLKLTKLLNLYLDNLIEKEEYLNQKNGLMGKRKTIEEQLTNLAEFQNDNIQKAKDFVRLTIQAGKITKQYLKIAENEGEDKTRIEPNQPPILTQELSQISALTPALADFFKKAELNLFLKDRKVYHIKQKPWAALRAAATGRNLVLREGFEPP
ncbi:MAG: Recombinase [Candidatus Beckwithbacteria bacterium GW2011_GWA2_47_25]|nr:MAG: Recombinase [Candidatus Beckwithbacteria bacterium GW2011_GWA1_46_30]KKU71364.1 MAG: Recombinase [Candidatus Beckwithbacteria bacterium GW2011_GWA2_47_25]